ncbi:MAG: hypothetical protein H5U07_02670 [Candidatus Aminicenantes bacterium]|nr:hypothetical protein [Candidatus Aminicenantes bacterium]
MNGIIYGPTYESGIWHVPAGTYQGRLIVGEFVKYEKGKTEVYYAPAIAIFDKDGKRVEVFLGRRASIHEGSERSNLFGCIAVPKR